MDSEQKLIESLGVPAVTKQITVNGKKINFLIAGSGQPIILIHGANIGWGQWHLNIPELTRHFTVYALDLPGAGQSDETKFRTADMETDFVDVVRGFLAEQDLKKVIIIGHSLGAWVALRLALRDKDIIKKLVLVSPVGLSERVPFQYRLMAFYFFAKFIAATAMKPTRANMEKFLKSVLHKDLPIAPKFVDYFHQAVRVSANRHPLLLINRLASFWKMSPELVLLNELHKIHHPVFIIGGDKDPVVRVDDLERAVVLFPQARLEIFSDVGHVPPMENFAEFNRRVIDFASK